MSKICFETSNSVEKLAFLELFLHHTVFFCLSPHLEASIPPSITVASRREIAALAQPGTTCTFCPYNAPVHILQWKKAPSVSLYSTLHVFWPPKMLPLPWAQQWKWAPNVLLYPLHPGSIFYLHPCSQSFLCCWARNGCMWWHQQMKSYLNNKKQVSRGA